ncbi:hypothetical protein PFUGPA_05036 [Plasmodium falciparum Palo Alto/Uganda]|uniref:Uncharacterized protein n=1 Tax=Plasmodium falciparum (isolate Palo Alto / Uganda) TaxID=57270 RepID=W4ISJ3_PLAFP|nr:hypothetical protein PFUGPA_05036 [Plasmodium falciparum Palo Alto/Uganda]
MNKIVPKLRLHFHKRTCNSMGIRVCKELNDEEKKKYFVDVNKLDNIKKDIRTRNKQQKRSKK